MWDGASGGGGASSKRSHEEAPHGHSSKNSSIDESRPGYFLPSGPAPKAPSDYPARHAYFIRKDPSDTDKRSSLPPSTYKIPALVPGGLTADHPISSENKPEHRDFSHTSQVHDKAELHSESNAEKADREVHVPEIKPGNSYLNWKEVKDHLRGKRYIEGNMESGTGSHFHAPNEIGTSDKMQGLLKLDSKGEEKFKEKDRKRKDGKYRDWGDGKKERSERVVGTSHADWSDPPREQWESDKWGRDVKHQAKEKERLIERSKDHYNVKSEQWDSDGLLLHPTRKVSDRAIKVEDHDVKYFEQKVECRRPTNKDVSSKANDRGADIEVDRPQKFNIVHDNMSDDRCIDVGGGAEGDKEALIHESLPRKRIHRPKRSPQISNNDDRSRCQGKPEPSFLIYKVGECMQELVKLWREYESYQPEANDVKSNDFPVLEIRIPAEHVSATNRQVRGGQLWGTDTYTVDSDLVAVLMHTGYCRPTASPPSPIIEELRATIRVLPPQECYVSSLRNNVRSRAWGSAIACSYQVEKCYIVKKGGGKFDLEPCASHTSTLDPTLAPVAVERTMTTRAAASNALRQQRFIREVTIQYSLSNEPWIKYSISIVADKGLKKPMYTSARLKKGEVLYLETHSCRYELCFSGEKTVKCGMHEGETERGRGQNIQVNGNDGDNLVVDTFRWSECKDPPLTQEVMRSFGVPLPLEFVEVLEDNIDWEDIQWSQSGVWVVGKEYPLTRVHFLAPN